MQDKELFSQLLGLTKPWVVTEMKVDYAALRVDLWVAWPPKEKVSCPECGKPCPIYDHREERQWRHLDTMQFQTILHSRIPRVECPTHGIKTISAPWAEERSRFTLLFERLAIDLLLGCQNQTKAGEILRLSWDEIHEIQGRAVMRGCSRRTEEPVPSLGIDEKSFLKGHQYVTIFTDIRRSRVIEVGKGRDKESVVAILAALPTEQKQSITAAVVDMWEAYIGAVETTLPDADIVHDKFHIVKHLGEAVDRVRKSENRVLVKEGETLLKGTKYVWLTSPTHWTPSQKETFRNLKQERLKTGRAWSIKEMFSSFWDYTYPKSAMTFFKKWYFWATHSRLKPMIAVARMLKRHLPHIITYLKHHVTNAVAEGINSKVQQIKSAARGFRSFDNFRVAILFYCGKLDMYPQKSR